MVKIDLLRIQWEACVDYHKCLVCQQGVLGKNKNIPSWNTGIEYAGSDEVHFCVGKGADGGEGTTPATNHKGKPGEGILRRTVVQYPSNG